MIIRLTRQESKKALEFFWKQCEHLAPDRLSETGDLVCPDLVMTLPLRLYLQSVVGYSLGLFDTCIATACMAMEFSLGNKMKYIVSEFHGLSDKSPLVFQSEADRDTWESELREDLDEISAKSYGGLIYLARTTKPDCESVNAICTCEL